jgi:response regulator RpfG family c-di-GMP phosphodiesterase
MAIEVVRHHHERWDCKGYPDRLGGSHIRLAARIVAIADASDAHGCRPLQTALGYAAAAVQVMTEA